MASPLPGLQLTSSEKLRKWLIWNPNTIPSRSALFLVIGSSSLDYLKQTSFASVENLDFHFRTFSWCWGLNPGHSACAAHTQPFSDLCCLKPCSGKSNNELHAADSVNIQFGRNRLFSLIEGKTWRPFISCPFMLLPHSSVAFTSTTVNPCSVLLLNLAGVGQSEPREKL